MKGAYQMPSDKKSNELLKQENVKVVNIPTESQGITREKIRALLPRGSNAKITDEVLQTIRNLETDTDMPQELMEQDVMSYMYMVGKIPGVGVTELVNAVKFCNLKRNYNNRQAWSIVFPDKYDKLVQEGRAIDNHVSAYNNSRMVTEIDKEMLIPVHIQYAGYFHEAVKTQYNLMKGNAGRYIDKEGREKDVIVTPMVKHLAAKELAAITRQPESVKIDMQLTQSDAMLEAQRETNMSINKMIEMQEKAFKEGLSTQELQKVHFVDHGENVSEAEIEE